MVKKIIFLFLLPLLLGCDEKEHIRMNEMMVFKNYLKSDSIPFNISQLFNKITIDSFDARQIQNKYKLRELDGIHKQYLLLKYAECFDEFCKVQEGENYFSRIKEFEQLDSYKIYAVTSITSECRMTSYVILISSLNTLDKEPYNSLVLYNTKRNNLCSLVQLAYGVENSEDLPPVLRAYKFDNTFLAVQDPIYPGMTEDHSLWNIRNWDELLITLGISKEHKTVINYSSFCIDSAGYLMFTGVDIEGILPNNKQ